MDVLCTFKIKIERQNSDHGRTKDHGPYPNQAQYVKPQSGPSSILQEFQAGLKAHGCSLHLQNPDKQLNLKHGCTKDQ